MNNSANRNFNSFRMNVTSQFGEDGIIGELLLRLNGPDATQPRWCVEFGAWDGEHLSNTFNLITNKGYHAVLIEADKERFDQLCRNLPQDSVVKVNAFVALEGGFALDSILSRTSIPVDFDVLSIDIDGNDYYILESLKIYHPKLVCIEFNPTIPNAVDYVQSRDFRVKRGASAKSIAALASAKGYAVVASTACNLILLDRRCLSSVGLPTEPNLDEVRDDVESRRYLFCGYDGTVMLSEPMHIPWHGLSITEKQLQVLPSFLRHFPDDYTSVQRLLFHILKALRKPRDACRRMSEILSSWRPH